MSFTCVLPFTEVSSPTLYQAHSVTHLLCVKEPTVKEDYNPAKSDKRPDPKPRKNAQLWQAYLWWYELMEMRKRHNLRISSIEKGKSNLDAQFEKDMIDHVQIDLLLKQVKKTMTLAGVTVGPIWDWLTGIKGLGEGGLAAQLIAQIDDIEKFENPAKLWRFAGFGVYNYWLDGNGKPVAPRDGHKWTGKGEHRRLVHEEAKPKPGWELSQVSDRNMEGWTSPFNRRLKGICFNIADQFIKQQTPVYVDIYYAEKERQRALHPEPVENGNGKKIYTDAHIHNRAWRKMIKEFLKDLWSEWRQGAG